MTVKFISQLSPAERVAHLLQQYLGLPFDDFKATIDGDDMEAVELLLAEYDALKARPASMWTSRDTSLAIILPSVTAMGTDDNGDVLVYVGAQIVKISDKRNKQTFMDAMTAYWKWHDATDVL